MRTSYSAIDTYLQCPQKYKFQEIDKIRAPRSKEALFGTLVHNTLKYMFESDPLFPTLDEVVAYFREHWPQESVWNQDSHQDPQKSAWSQEDEKRYFEEGVRMLKRFYEKNAPWNYIIAGLESHFEIMLADEKTGRTHILAGKIDRIDKIPAGYEIIDYKTSRRMPSQANLDENLQLALYSLGLQKRWPHLKPEEISLSLYFLKHGEKLTTKASAEKTEKTKEHIVSTIREIEERQSTGREFEPMPGPLCNWCSFRPQCPAWKHLYRNQESRIKNQEEIDAVLKEYFEIKKVSQTNDSRLDELQEQIAVYMEQEGLTRVFGEGGVISKKIQQRYEYDFEKVKSILSPLGKWEEILKADETKLKKIMGEIPVDARHAIEEARRVLREFSVLTSSIKKVKTSGEVSPKGSLTKADVQ